MKLFRSNSWLYLQDYYTRNLRRTIIRYTNLSSLLVLRLISTKVKKEFPTYKSLLEAKVLLPHEVQSITNNLLSIFSIAFGLVNGKGNLLLWYSFILYSAISINNQTRTHTNFILSSLVSQHNMVEVKNNIYFYVGGKVAKT